MKKYLVFWKTIAWTVFIMVLFLIPSQNIPGSREIPHLDKAVHIVFFMVFTILFMRDMLKIKRLKIIPISYILITLLVVLSLAIMVEGLQDIMKLGREGDIVDIFYDLLGFWVGMLFLFLIFRIRNRSL
jgi:glycopeptide antibiotics resistance protein